MGRLIGPALVLAGLLAVVSAASPAAALGFERFGRTDATATYGVEMTFNVELVGGAPDRLELLLRFGETDVDHVAPVTASGGSATYRWDAAADHVVPNTLVTYRWRATDGDRVTLSQPSEVRYDDNRPGLDWRSESIGEANVHWYGNAERQARRFGELTAVAASRAEELLGHEMAGPVDIFVYATRTDFFGALGPGAREWTGAAAYPHLRTVFMYLEGGSQVYLETAVIHEVTHVIFHDATDNPYHEPARWLNEGIATWSEAQNGDAERSIVVFEADGGGLFAFEAIATQFPIGERGGRLAYAQGTTLIDMIIGQHGTQAIARMTAAYRDGASDAEAIEAATGRPADQLFAAFFDAFGVEQPQPIEPAPMLPSNVALPPSTNVDGGAHPTLQPSGQATPSEPPVADTEDRAVIVALLAAAGVVLGAAVIVARRARAAEDAS